MRNHGTLTRTSASPLFPPSPGSGSLILPFPLLLRVQKIAASPARKKGAIAIVSQKSQPCREMPGQACAEP